MKTFTPKQENEIDNLANQIANASIDMTNYIKHDLEDAIDSEFVISYKKEVLKLIVTKIISVI